jgi:hypothetical protein
MTNKANTDVLARLTGANPVTLTQLATLHLPKPALPARQLRTATRARWRSPLAAVSLAIVMAVAIATPAIAISDRLQDLFGFTNTGSSVADSSLTLDQISALAQVGFTDGVRRLAAREGVAFYVGRASSGALCFATGPVPGEKPKFGVLACQGVVSGAFPSPTMPIADFSPMRSQGPSNAVYVTRLVGFAANGVTSVAVRDVNGDLHSARVIGNVYVSEPLPAVPATAIVARDSAGDILYSEPLESSTPG